MRCFVNILLLLLSVSTICKGQFQGKIFQENFDTKVYYGSTEKKNAWAGGFNAPQFASGDLNNDGLRDLVIYEQDHKNVKTFINKGTAGNPVFKYDPGYSYNFPEIIKYLKLIDYNRDGIPDLVHRGLSGFSVHKGHYDNLNRLAFTFYRELFYEIPSGWSNVYTEPGDIPAIVDVDNDGDLDFLAFYIGGSYVNFYRNCQVENALPPDSIRICLKDNCWGKVKQAIVRTHLLGIQCDMTGTTCKGCPPEDGSANKTTHIGNTTSLVDIDGDGDLDFLGGSVSYNDIQLLINGKADYGYIRDTIIAQDTSWAGNGKKVDINLWPAAFPLDVDGDSDIDLLFSPHQSGSENYRSAWYYKNTGSVSSPSYTFQTDSFLVGDMIDVGTGSYPAFYDYDKDGKLDLFIGSDGYFQQNGTLKGQVMYLRNTSSGSATSFEIQAKDFLQMGNQNFKGAVPAFGDVDGDGKDDMVIGHTDGTLSLYINTAGTATDQPNWVLSTLIMRDRVGSNMNVGGFAAPFIYDIDKDGMKDLIIGCQAGYLFFYKNVNTSPGTVRMEFVTNQLGGVKVDVNEGYSTPYVGRMDNTGTDYLVVGSESGVLYRYDGFQAGNVTTPFVLIDTVYSQLSLVERTAPAFTDLNGDNKYDMVVGSELGGLNFFKQLFDVGVEAVSYHNEGLKIYPNPARNMLFVEGLKNKGVEVNIRLVSPLGQIVLSKDFSGLLSEIQIDISSVSAGLYYLSIQQSSSINTCPVSIVK